MSTSVPETRTPITVTAPSKKSWRVIDIIALAVLGVAAGLVFWIYNGPGGAFYESISAVTPGFGGLAVGPWLFAGVLGGLVIRKPGAALLCEVIAASVSAGLGNPWGISTLYSGIAQGLGAEIILAIFLYRRFGPVVAALAGAGAGVGAWILEGFFYGNFAKSTEFQVTYLATLLVSGAVIAGICSWLLVRALAATGALDRFAAGRERQRQV